MMTFGELEMFALFEAEDIKEVFIKVSSILGVSIAGVLVGFCEDIKVNKAFITTYVYNTGEKQIMNVKN